MEVKEIQLLHSSLQRILAEGRELDGLAELLLSRGLPRSPEELEEYRCRLPERHSLQDHMAGLYALQCGREKAENTALGGLYEQLETLLDRMTAVNVMAMELLHRFSEETPRYDAISGLYAGLAVLRGAMEERIEALETAIGELDELWARLPENAPEEQEETLESLWELDDYGYIFQVLGECLTVYLQQHQEDRVQSFADRLRSYLMDFAQGKAKGQCDFALVLQEGDAKQYFSFTGDGEAFTLRDGAHVYTPGVGVDNYTNWTYTLHRSGRTQGELWLSGESLMERISLGAVLELTDSEFTED